MDSNLFNKYYNLTLRFLSFRPRSKKEIKEYLNRKKVDLAVINKIVEKLEGYNFLDDEEFTKWWIEQRTNFKSRSIRLIKLELKQKGIPNELIEDIIQDSSLIIQNDLERAKTIVEKKIDKYKGLSKYEIYKKLGGILTRRGFDYETIKRSIDEALFKVV